MAFAVPTRGTVNRIVVQYWQHTKEASPNPIMHRTTMKAAPDVTSGIPKTADDDSSRRKPMPYRGPNLFVNDPSTKRAKMAPTTCTAECEKNHYIFRQSLKPWHPTREFVGQPVNVAIHGPLKQNMQNP
jgi:hypothetical protein